MKLPKCKYEGTEMDLATLKGSVDVGFEDHGIFIMSASFEYYPCSQGLGYCIDHKFIMKFIRAFGVSMLSECSGEIFVEHANGVGILRLIPLETKGGEEFDIASFTKQIGVKLR